MHANTKPYSTLSDSTSYLICQVHYAGVKLVGGEKVGSEVWSASVVLCGHVRHLGMYDCPEDAASAYNKAVESIRNLCQPTAAAKCRYSAALDGLLLNPVDGVGYCLHLHAPPVAHESMLQDGQGGQHSPAPRDPCDEAAQEDGLGQEEAHGESRSTHEKKETLSKETQDALCL